VGLDAGAGPAGEHEGVGRAAGGHVAQLAGKRAGERDGAVVGTLGASQVDALAALLPSPAGAGGGRGGGQVEICDLQGGGLTEAGAGAGEEGHQGPPVGGIRRR